ncbi:hypothetical protein PybrP1_005144 [[Pythium] brassicae (nom. inval.)]|nr:hypothetical protein PybrP1_005144 [[Pythium] brassicae (nom. inval.)]
MDDSRSSSGETLLKNPFFLFSVLLAVAGVVGSAVAYRAKERRHQRHATQQAAWVRFSQRSPTTTMSRRSTHFVGEKVRALCFLKDVRSSEAHDQFDFLPLVAAGGWDSERNHVALHLPILPTRDEHELRREFGRYAEGHEDGDVRACELSQVAEAPHAGDVNALQFVATKGENLLFTASSSGSVLCFRVSDTSSAMSDDADVAPVAADSPLSSFAIPQWENVFGGSPVTCLDASESKSVLVAASEAGGVAWLQLDDVMSVSKIVNKDASKLAIHGVKILGQDAIAVSVGYGDRSTPGSQLRIWDATANRSYPVLTASDPHSSAVLTSVETHPTRPELLLTGAEDGRVCLWDQRRLDAPFRTETKHQRAVRALKLHSAAPRFLYSCGDDATVLSWDFHHGARPRDAVEYDAHAALQVDAVASSSQPWNAVAVHAESDTLVAASDAQTIVLVQHASKAQQQRFL